MFLHPDINVALEKAVENENPQSFEKLVEVILKELNTQILAEWERVGRPKGFAVRDLLRLPVTFCQLLMIAPEITIEALDLLSQAWLENRPELLQKLAGFTPKAKAPQALWQIFWEDVKAPPLNLDIKRVLQFNAAMDLSVRETYEAIMLERPGVAQAFNSGSVRPSSMTLESLADYPEDTLAYSFYHQLADNNLSLEIIKDRPQNVFEDERANYVGLRVYQTHDIWHVLLGYSVSGMDEITLQAFQLAQVGSASSARILTLLVTRAMLNGFYALPPLFNAIFKGWQHGRQTRQLLPIYWEELWNQPLSELRERYQIQAVAVR